MIAPLAEWNRADLTIKWNGWEVAIMADLEDTGVCLMPDEALWLLDFLRTHEKDLRLKAAEERQG